MSPREFLEDARALVRGKTRLFGATTVGKGVRVWGRPAIGNRGTIRIGDYACIASTTAPIQLVAEPGATLDIGAHCFMNYGSLIAATSRIEIGARCKLGMDVMVLDDKHYRGLFEADAEEVATEKRPTSAGSLVLGENVWLCARSMVLGQVTIGAGSVIAAGSIVTSDIPERVLAAGRPARVIRSI